MKIRIVWAAAVLLVAVPTSARAESKTELKVVRTAQPLNSSLLLLNEGDLERCPALVAKAATVGNDRVNLVSTLHFFTADRVHLTGYCFATTTSGCVPLDQAQVNRFTSLMKTCVSAVFAHGMRVSITPHIDDARTGVWRNDMIFDPYAKLAGFSYQDAVLAPLVQALVDSKPNDGREYSVDFALEGEMGGTVFQYPAAYESLYQWVKWQLSGFNNKVGVSLNFNKAAGTAAPVLPTEIPNLQRLLDTVDF